APLLLRTSLLPSGKRACSAGSRQCAINVMRFRWMRSDSIDVFCRRPRLEGCWSRQAVNAQALYLRGPAKESDLQRLKNEAQRPPCWGNRERLVLIQPCRRVASIRSVDLWKSGYNPQF